MLRAAAIPFEAHDPMVDEDELKRSLRAAGVSARAMADTLGEAKALRVSRASPGRLVLGADQILARENGQILDKASDMDALRAQLLELRGRAHRLISAAVIAEDGRAIWRHADTATLHVRRFSENWLDDYLCAEGETLLRGVGGYRIEGRGVQLFDRVQGDQFTIRGLPLVPLTVYLRQRGVLPA